MSNGPRAPDQAARLGAEVEEIIRPLFGLANLLEGYQGCDAERVLEMRDHAQDVAALSAKGLRDLLEARERIGVPSIIEDDLRTAEGYLAAINAMAALLHFEETAARTLPTTGEERGALTPSRDRIMSTLVRLGSQALDRYVTDSAIRRWRQIAEECEAEEASPMNATTLAHGLITDLRTYLEDVEVLLDALESAMEDPDAFLAALEEEPAPHPE